MKRLIVQFSRLIVQAPGSDVLVFGQETEFQIRAKEQVR